MEDELLARIKDLEARLDRIENPVKVITIYPRAAAVEAPSNDEKERLMKEYLKSANN